MIAPRPGEEGEEGMTPADRGFRFGDCRLAVALLELDRQWGRALLRAEVLPGGHDECGGPGGNLHDPLHPAQRCGG